MAVAVYNHYKRLYNNISINKPPQNSPENFNTNIPNQQHRGILNIICSWVLFSFFWFYS
jgi:ATP-dependent protease Clp ATPase subunit